MRENSPKRLFAHGGTAIDALLSIASTYSAEGVARQGFASITVDLRHGMIGFESAIAMFQAISTTEAIPLTRVPRNDRAQVMQLLDAGAYGLICPMISTVDDAWPFARACRYPDRGSRSFGPARALLDGGAGYLARANDEILVIPMIETCEGVENVDAILEIEKVDTACIGPNDLALAQRELPGMEAGAERAAPKGSRQCHGVGHCPGGDDVVDAPLAIHHLEGTATADGADRRVA